MDSTVPYFLLFLNSPESIWLGINILCILSVSNINNSTQLNSDFTPDLCLALLCCDTDLELVCHSDLQAPEADYLDAVVVTILQIHVTQPGKYVRNSYVSNEGVPVLFLTSGRK